MLEEVRMVTQTEELIEDDPTMYLVDTFEGKKLDLLSRHE